MNTCGNSIPAYLMFLQNAILSPRLDQTIACGWGLRSSAARGVRRIDLPNVSPSRISVTKIELSSAYAMYRPSGLQLNADWTARALRVSFTLLPPLGETRCICARPSSSLAR